MGSVISENHLQRVHGMVSRRSTGNIVLGGMRLEGRSPLDGFDLSKGCFYAPTIISDIETSDELWKEEVFGPVVVTKSFSVSARFLLKDSDS